MIDAHCHLDLYRRPNDIASEANRAGVLVIGMTNLPSAFRAALPHVRQFRNVRLALGLHPQLAAQHAAERTAFAALASMTSYIGEVGLDFSRDAIATRDEQTMSFRLVLQTLRGKPKFMSVHSRRAEPTVLDLLEEERRSPVVLHWFSGPPTALDRALAQGHFFSVNPGMLATTSGRRTVSLLPSERVLTETDGPFVKVGRKPATPSDVALVEEYLAGLWHMPRDRASARIRENLMAVLEPLRRAAILSEP